MSKLGEIIKKLSLEEPLDIKHRNHRLKGIYLGRWE
jgi:mRNA-degrading endonuclease YafQ of YafQ-DinJ toxin-antitoxin module